MEQSINNDNYNADEIEAPEWLNTPFFEKVLKNYTKSTELKVIDVKITPASPKGDHYASVMFRSIVEYTILKEQFSKSLIIKTMPVQEGHKKELLADSFIFKTEIGMYTRALPKFEEILSKSGDNTKLCVPCVYHSLEPHQVIILEDLIPQGYIVIRHREASIEELQAAFSKLAKWQAVSFYMLQEEPDYLREFKYGIFDIPNLFDNSFMTSGMRLFLDFLDTVPELSKYKSYFKRLENDYIDHMKEIMLEYRENRQSNGYYVLCHGDFHLRNMMFKHNKANGTLEDCMLLDFQSNNIVPISVDVIFSIYMLMGIKERRHNYKQLINFYFSEFVVTLQKIGFKGELPNVMEFWKQIFAHKYYDIFLITTFLPMAIGVNAFDVADVLQKEEVRRKLYFLDNYVEDVKHLLIRFEEQGYFE